MDPGYPLEELPEVAEGKSQTDSEDAYWRTSESQEELWEELEVTAVVHVNPSDDKSTAGSASPGADGTEASVHDKIVQSPKVVPEDDDKHLSPPPSSSSQSKLKGKGKATVLGPGSDDDALWAEFPSSQLVEPIPTQPSSIFSESSSHNTSMTSVSSSSSGKRKRTDSEPLPPLMEEVAKSMLNPAERRRIESVRTAPGPSQLPEMHLEEPVAGPSTTPELNGNVIIAHDRTVQRHMDALNISWGVQYEIARGVCDGRWTWRDVTPEKLQKLVGTSQEAAQRVPYIIKGSSSSAQCSTGRDIWVELDREQEAILEHEDRGLGLKGEWQGKDNWYGGRIQQIAKMEFVQDTNSFIIRLEKMQMTRSHRFARFLGSRHLLQMKNSGDRRDIALERKFLMQRFILCGRVFVPFSSKDGKVYLMETSDDYERTPSDAEGDQHRLSLEEFVQWHNPMSLNQRQPVAKWATRFDLGLSTSVPVLRFAPGSIAMEDDVCAKYDGPKPPTDKIFTDGCGWINRAALVAIAQHVGLTEVPTAVQGRVFGAKGVWILHPHNHLEKEPKIWIRPSQLKIKLYKSDELDVSELQDLHPAHFIFDLVAPSIVTLKTRLNRLTVVNLAHNGVPRDVFVNLMRENLEKELKPLTRWDCQYAMPLLSFYADKSSGASSSRLQQFISGAQRALGHSRKREKDESPHDDYGTLVSRALASGRPLSASEEVLHLIRAGFKPTEEPYVFEHLRTVISYILDGTIKTFHIPVLNSADAFIVPDPFSILEEGEIHFTSSKNLQEPSLQCLDPKTIIGDVLLYRNPARLPSDIRKVKAVDCPALRRYTDVIVLPTKGTCSLASLLAGGDVDGDVAVCIWDKDIVDAFKNAPVEPMPEDILETYFEPESAIHTVAEVHNEIQSSPTHARGVLQQHLLSGLTESKVGIYSTYHENLAYAKGYGHQETLRMAYMFNILLDSRKTGHVVKDAVFQQDKSKYNRDPPPCMADSDRSLHNPTHLRRSKGLPKFILEELLSAGGRLRDKYLSDYDKQRPLNIRTGGCDEHVLQPYKRFSDLPDFANELRVVKDFVTLFYERYKEIWNVSPQKAHTNPSNQKRIQAKQTEALRSLVTEYTHSMPHKDVDKLVAVDALKRVAASYAYSLSAKFAFCVAFREITLIKAMACGIFPISEEMVAPMTVSAGYARAIEQKILGTA